MYLCFSRLLASTVLFLGLVIHTLLAMSEADTKNVSSYEACGLDPYGDARNAPSMLYLVRF